MVRINMFIKSVFKLTQKRNIYNQNKRMSNFFKGKVVIKENELNLDLTLLGGQSFRWKKVINTAEEPEWSGVAYDAFWVLTQTPDAVLYTVYPSSTAEESFDAGYYQNLIERYFRIEFNLPANVELWKKSHEHFTQIVPNMTSVRVLNQEPFENILSFMCSQNNHIKRISDMIQWLCVKYGTRIGHFNGSDEFTFPKFETLTKQQKKLELNLREAKFGYRAKFIAQTIGKIEEFNGEDWFHQLRNMPYSEARLELVKLPGIGLKVADCICLMSLNHLESVPIDTHIYKVVQKSYMPQLDKVKTVTPKIYEQISTYFRSVYGPNAGWTQAVLFCAGLQQFQAKTDKKATKTAQRKTVKKQVKGM